MAKPGTAAIKVDIASDKYGTAAFFGVRRKGYSKLRRRFAPIYIYKAKRAAGAPQL